MTSQTPPLTPAERAAAAEPHVDLDGRRCPACGLEFLAEYYPVHLEDAHARGVLDPAGMEAAYVQLQDAGARVRLSQEAFDVVRYLVHWAVGCAAQAVHRARRRAR